MSLATILPEQAFPPLLGPLAPYDNVFWDVENEPDFGLTSRTKMVALPAISLATLEVRSAPAKAWRPDTRGIVTEASLRIAIWKDRGRSLSAFDMALSFQYLYFRGDGNRGGKVPLLGLDLLRGDRAVGQCSHRRRRVRVRASAPQERNSNVRTFIFDIAKSARYDLSGGRESRSGKVVLSPSTIRATTVVGAGTPRTAPFETGDLQGH